MILSSGERGERKEKGKKEKKKEEKKKKEGNEEGEESESVCMSSSSNQVVVDYIRCVYNWFGFRVRKEWKSWERKGARSVDEKKFEWNKKERKRMKEMKKRN